MFKTTHLLAASAIFMPMTTLAPEMTDYLQHETTFDEAYLTGRFNLNDGNQEQTSFNGSMLGYYDITYSTLPLTWNFRIDGSTDFSRGGNDGESTETGYDITASTDAKKYFGNTRGLFVYGSLDLGYRQLFAADQADDPYTKLGTGVGYGRIFNATPLAYVLRFVDELKEYGVIIGHIDDSTYLEMATIIARINGFKNKYGLHDYKQHWIAAIEDILKKAGVLKNNALGALGVLKMHDVLFEERVNLRKHGWTVQAGVGFVASDYSGNEGDPSLDLSFEYTLPISYSFQFIELAEYSTILNDNIIHYAHNRMSVTYEISDRIDWENAWDVKITLPTEDGSNDLISHELNSIFRYYLSNRLTADLTLSLSDVEDDVDGNNNDELETAIFMGLTYRLK